MKNNGKSRRERREKEKRHFWYFKEDLGGYSAVKWHWGSVISAGRMESYHKSDVQEEGTCALSS